MTAATWQRVCVNTFVLALVLFHFDGGSAKGSDENTATRPPDATLRDTDDQPAGFTPAEAAQRMTVADGFQVQLAAGEPMVHQPIAFTIDPRGRLWVAEAYTYPVRAAEGKGRDTIAILEDTNGDGVFDNRKVFVEGLNLVSGLEVGFGGVWVGAAPYLLFIPDRNADDQPDSEPEVLLDGFGYQDTHETLNSFIWGPDGWLYGCHGIFTHSNVGPPGTAADQRIPLNAGVWRFHPTEKDFEVFAWGTSNPWGVDFDDHGQAFCTACVIPHLFHVIQGARYQRQAGRHFNPYVFDDIKTIADHLHYTGNIRDHAWWGHEPTVPGGTLAAGGGHAHCGAMIYLGGSWPDEFRRRILFHNIHGNRVNQDLLERSGSGFVGRHGDDLLLANDPWFRGINLRYGPDGSVYLIDWYDRNACHRRTPEIWDRSNGRIYRVSYRGGKPAASDDHDFRLPKTNDLRTLDSHTLVALQSHHNDWYVRTARRILQERGAEADIHRELVEMFETAESVPTRLRAMWALHTTEGITEQFALQCLEDPAEYVRAWSVQLHLERQPPSRAFLARMAVLAGSDPSPVVRLYLASSLQKLPLEQRWQLAATLTTHAEDQQDHNLPLMYWYGVEPLVLADAPRALALAARTSIPLLQHFIYRRAASDPNTLPEVIRELADEPQESGKILILDAILDGFRGRTDIRMPEAWRDLAPSLLMDASSGVRQRAEQVAIALGDQTVLPRLRSTLANARAPIPDRVRALRLVLKAQDQACVPALLGALRENALRLEVLNALASFDDPTIPPAILGVYSALDPEQRRSAIATLVTRKSSAMKLLDAMHQEVIPRTDLHAFHVRQLLQFEDPQLSRRIDELWGAVRESSGDKKASIDRHKAELSRAALAAARRKNGRLLFNKTCAACHTLFGEGGKVGPDITGSDRMNLDYLLSNIVDPSAVLGKDYRLTVVVTDDGRVLSGMVVDETDSAVTLRTINDTVVVSKQRIDDRSISNQSLMPDQLLDGLSPAERADLIAYLMSPQQVPLE